MQQTTQKRTDQMHADHRESAQFWGRRMQIVNAALEEMQDSDCGCPPSECMSGPWDKCSFCKEHEQLMTRKYAIESNALDELLHYGMIRELADALRQETARQLTNLQDAGIAKEHADRSRLTRIMHLLGEVDKEVQGWR